MDKREKEVVEVGVPEEGEYFQSICPRNVYVPIDDDDDIGMLMNGRKREREIDR